MSSKKGQKRKRDTKDHYYKYISGVKYDRGMLKVAEKADKTRDKLNMDDCKKLYKEVVDGNKYTDTEKATMKYIRENYKFEKAADQYLRRAIASWSQKKR